MGNRYTKTPSFRRTNRTTSVAFPPERMKVFKAAQVAAKVPSFNAWLLLAAEAYLERGAEAIETDARKAKRSGGSSSSVSTVVGLLKVLKAPEFLTPSLKTGRLPCPFPARLTGGKVVVDEICYCGALRSRHQDTMMYGHGACPATDCRQFRYQSWVEGKATLAELRATCLRLGFPADYMKKKPSDRKSKKGAPRK